MQCADVHCRTFIVQSADEMTKELHTKLTPELTLVLRQLVELYAVDTCMRLLGDLIRVSSIVSFTNLRSYNSNSPKFRCFHFSLPV